MDTIDIPATNNTPAIKFADGKLSISGRAISNKEISFYQPVTEWAGKVQINRLIVDINLEYINSVSSKKLLNLLKTLDNNKGIRSLIVNWFYEEGDEDTLLKGQLFDESLPKAEFRFHLNTEET